MFRIRPPPNVTLLLLLSLPSCYDRSVDSEHREDLKASRWAIVVLCIASLLPLAAAFRLDPRFPGDDALITLTYAKNLAQGNGFVFNHEPPVLGTTTPAFACAVALVSFITRAEPTVIALWISSLCWLGLIWVFFGFRRAFGLDVFQATTIGALLAAKGWVGHLSMEAYPFAVVQVLAAGLVLGGRPLAGGFFAGLLFLIRGEGVLFAALLGLVVLGREWRCRGDGGGRSPTMLFVLAAASPIAAWATFAFPTFGSMLPHTLTAKLAQVSSGLWAPFPVRLFEQWLPGWYLAPSGGVVAAIVAYVCVGLGLVKISTGVRRMWVFPAWGLVYCVGYASLGVPGYPWYRLPLELVLTILAGLGLACVGHRLKVGGRQWVGPVIVALIVLGSAYPTFRHLVKADVPDRGRAYYRLAQWFEHHAQPQETIAYMEIGYLGYYTELGVLDLVGLVTPEAIPHVARRDFSTVFWATMPDYLVELEGSEFIRPIVEHPLFSRGYEPVGRVEGFSDLDLTIYRRR